MLEDLSLLILAILNLVTPPEEVYIIDNPLMSVNRSNVSFLITLKNTNRYTYLDNITVKICFGLYKYSQMYFKMFL